MTLVSSSSEEQICATKSTQTAAAKPLWTNDQSHSVLNVFSFDAKTCEVSQSRIILGVEPRTRRLENQHENAGSGF